MSKGKLKEKIKDSKLWNWTKEKFPDIAGKGLEIFGDLTGRDSIEGLGKWIQGQDELSDEDKKQAAALTALDVQLFQEQERALTDRHKADMLSDSWLSKNVRPIVVLNFTALIDYVIISGTYGNELKDVYIDLIIMLGINVFSFYFAGRDIIKRTKLKNK